MTEWFFGWLGLCVLMALLGTWVSLQKRRPPEEGLVLGILFGPLGVIVEGLLPDGEDEEDEAD